jgi:DcuC family C4-dicarboxylate transporter
MFPAIGLCIVLVTAYCLIKQYETRMVLFCAGLLMTLISGHPFDSFEAFTNSMKEYRIFEPIVTVIAFTGVMKVTQCDQHLIHLLARSLTRVKKLIVPGAIIVTFFVNTSLTSAAGCAAAVGAVLIPLMIAQGVHPAIAGAAVLSGTFGNMLNPGFVQVVYVAELAKISPTAVIANHFSAIMASVVIVALSLTLIAYWRKRSENSFEGGGEIDCQVEQSKAFDVKLLYAIVPMLPLMILLLGSTGTVPIFKKLLISHTMIIGTLIAFAVTRMSPKKISEAFFKSMGDSFGHIFGIILCAAVFVSGMKSLGLIQAMIDTMISNPSIAKVSAALGPFLLAALSGSGEAAGFAFNKSVSIEAAQFGLHVSDMGSMAAIAAMIGRAASPIAGVTIVCASIAKVTTVDIVKCSAPGMIVACIATMIMLLYR